MNPIDPNFAPPGMVATLIYPKIAHGFRLMCTGCEATQKECLDFEMQCAAHLRPDGREVIFVRKESKE